MRLTKMVLKDYLALVPCVIFGIAHVTITWSNYVR
jgi:hypothetical protein